MDIIDIQTPIQRVDGSLIDIEEVDQKYTSWVHTGRNIIISPCDNMYAQSKMHDPNVYSIAKHIRGKAILISNTGYQALRLLKDLFTQMGYKIVVHAEINASEDMLAVIQREVSREENELVDSFVIIIYGTPEGLQLSHIAQSMQTNCAPYLSNKPKLVYVIGEESIVQQVLQINKHGMDPDLLLAATGFYGMMFFIYVFCTYVHELSARDIWKLLLQYSAYHRFSSSTLCTLRKDFFFFPGVSKSVLPSFESANLNPRDLAMYRKVLEQGIVKSYNVRLMFVGLFGAGKTSTARRIMGREISDVTSTDGIDVYIGKCRVDLVTGRWETLDDSETIKPYKQLSDIVKNPNRFLESVEMFPVDGEITGHVQKRRKRGDQIVTSSTISDQRSWDIISPDTSTSDLQDMDFAQFPDIEMNDEESIRINKPEFLRTAQRVIRDSENVTDRSSEVAQVSLWDFAGQYVYYATHQLFFSPRSIYLLILNLEKDLNEVLGDWYMDIGGMESIESQGGIHFWLSSIYTYAKGSGGRGIPPIVLVGTHKDKIPGDEKEKIRKARRYFTNIRDIFHDTPIADNIMDCDIILDNSTQDTNIDQLKEAIMDIAKRSSYWGDEVPARWVELQQALCDRRSDGSNFILMKDLKKINNMLAYPLESGDHLRLFLRVQHEMGMLIYFEDSEMLRDTIILEPQWIIHAFRHLIRAKDFSEKYGQLKKQWEEFNDTGKLSIALAESIWKQDHKNHFYENFDLLLRFLERLDIIVRASELKEDGKTKTPLDYYYVPCLLKEVPPHQLLQPVRASNSVSTPILCFKFSNNFLPPAIFNRVIALCLAKWPIARQGKTRFLYCGCAVFEVRERINEDRHRLQIFFKRSKVGIRVTRYSSKEIKHTDLQVCDRVKRFVAFAIRKEFKRFNSTNYDDNDPFSYQLQCGKEEENNMLEQGMLEWRDVVKAVDTDAFCTLHATGPHQYEPVQLLVEWFNDSIPEQHRVEKESLLDQWIRQLHIPEDLVTRSKFDSLLTKLTVALGKNWQFFMRDQLGIKQVCLSRLEEEHPRHVKRQMYEAFKNWQSREKDEATCSALLNALKRSVGVNINWEVVKNAFEGMK